MSDSSQSVADQLKSLGYPQAHFATDADGNDGIIPSSQLDQAKQNGYTVKEPAVYMTDPGGKLGLVPRSQAKTALDKGYKVGQPINSMNAAPAQVNYVPNAQDREMMANPANVVANTKPIQPPNIQVKPVGALTGTSTPLPYETKDNKPLAPIEDAGLPGSFEGHPENVGETMNDTPLLAGPAMIAREAMKRSAEDSPDWVKNTVTPAGEAAADQLEALSTPSTIGALGGMRLLGAASPLARTLARAAQGYFGVKMGEGLVHGAEQTGQAIGEGDTAGAVRAGLNTAASGAMLGDTARGVIDSAPGSVDDLKATAKSASDVLPDRNAIADTLRQSAVDQYSRAIAPTTRQNKNLTAKVVPELLDRGISAVSPASLAKRAGKNLEAAGQNVQDIWDNLPEGTKVEAAPLMHRLDEYRKEFQNQVPIPESEAADIIGDKAKSAETPVTVQQNADGSKSYLKTVDVDQDAVRAINDLQTMIAQHGAEIPATAIRKIRDIMQGKVARSGGYAGVPLAEGSKVDAMRELASAAQEQIGKLDPNMKNANAEYSFWKNVERVAKATAERRVGQQGGLKKIAYKSAGAVLGAAAGGPGGAALGLQAGDVASKVGSSSLWNTNAARTKNFLASLIRRSNDSSAAPSENLPPDSEPPQLPPSGNPPLPSPSGDQGTPPTGPSGLPFFLRGKMEHPDVPGGKVVALDADTHLPIVKRDVAPTEDTSDSSHQNDVAKPEVESQPDKYRQAVEAVQQFGSGSTSLLQRRLRISHDEATGLLDRMSNEGIIEPADGPKPRSVIQPEPTAAAESKKPSNPILRAVQQSNLPGRPTENVRMVNPKDLVVDPREMQWRTLPRNSIKEGSPWDQAKAGPIDIWNNPERGWQVVDGHHRINHAIANNVPEIEARVHQFPTVSDAKQFGALRNIENGNATPFDAALYLRESGLKPDELATRGINPESDFVKKSSGLANLSNTLWEQYRSGNLDEAKAVAIGQNLSDPSQQSALANLASRSRLSAAEIEQAARRIRDAGSSVSETQSLFGNDQKSISNFVETAKVSAKVEKQLQQDKSALNFIANASDVKKAALERAKNIINLDETSKQALTAQVLAEAFQKLQNRSGEVQRLLDDAGTRITKGEDRNAVYNEIYPKVREAILREIGTQGGGPDSGGSGGGAQGSGDVESGRSDAQGKTSNDEGPVTPEGAGDLFRFSGPQDRANFARDSSHIKAEFHPKEDRLPAWVKVNDQALSVIQRIFRDSSGRKIEFAGVNAGSISAEQILRGLDRYSKLVGVEDARASEKLDGLREAIDKATDNEDGLNIVSDDGKIAAHLLTYKEEMLHSAVQRRPGKGDIRNGVPYDEMWKDPGIQAMVPEFAARGVDSKPFVVAEGVISILMGEHHIEPEMARKTITRYWDTVASKYGVDVLHDAMAVLESFRQKVAENSVSAEELPDDRLAWESLSSAIERHSGSGAGDESLLSRSDERGNRQSEKDQGPDGRGQDDGSGGDGSDLTRPQAQRLADSSLESWIRGARSIEVRPAGEQKSLLGPPEKMFQLVRTDSNGDIEKHLVSESQYEQLNKFQPFSDRVNAGKQQGMFGDNSGEIIGSGKRGGIELPPQSSDTQGTLFRSSKVPVFLRRKG